MLPWNRLPKGTHRLLAGVALASLALGILWSLQAATYGEATTELRRVDPWAERATFTYAPLLEDGTELAMGEPGYFTTHAPRVRVGFAWTLDDPRAERVTALGELQLVVRHDASGGRPAWNDARTLAEGTLEGDAPEPLTLEALLDLPAESARIESVPGRDASRATWTLVANVRFASAPVVEHRAERSGFEMPLSYTPPLYSLPPPDALSLTKDHTKTQVVHHPAPSAAESLAARPAGPALLVVGLVGLALSLPRLASEEELA